MSRDKIKAEILQLVLAHNGEWYWYQVDRALSERHMRPFMHEVRELIADGFIESRINSTLGDIPRYWITETGRAAAV